MRLQDASPVTPEDLPLCWQQVGDAFMNNSRLGPFIGARSPFLQAMWHGRGCSGACVERCNVNVRLRERKATTGIRRGSLQGFGRFSPRFVPPPARTLILKFSPLCSVLAPIFHAAVMGMHTRDTCMQKHRAKISREL